MRIRTSDILFGAVVAIPFVGITLFKTGLNSDVVFWLDVGGIVFLIVAAFVKAIFEKDA